MASRYAAAHARREQRRRESAGREFLPLADEVAPPVANPSGVAPTTGGKFALPSLRGEATLTSRLPTMDYSYLRGDLMRTLILAVILFAAMIILSFFV